MKAAAVNHGRNGLTKPKGAHPGVAAAPAECPAPDVTGGGALAFPKPLPRERRPPKGLKRSGYIERKTPLKAKRAKERRTAQVRDEAWKAAVRKLPCVVHEDPRDCTWPPGVKRRSDPSHTCPDHGLGQKGNDRKTVPMCRGAHGDWEFGRGQFKGLTKEQRRAMAAPWVARTEVEIEKRRAAA